MPEPSAAPHADDSTETHPDHPALLEADLVTAWDTYLTELEQDVITVVNGGDLSHKPFTTPTALGPLPGVWADRVARLIEANKAVAERLEVEQGEIRQHLATLRAVTTAPDGGPVYLDREG